MKELARDWKGCAEQHRHFFEVYTRKLDCIYSSAECRIFHVKKRITANNGNPPRQPVVVSVRVVELSSHGRDIKMRINSRNSRRRRKAEIHKDTVSACILFPIRVIPIRLR